MRVLWFSTNPACYEYSKSGNGGYNGGGWTSSLQHELTKQTGITLGVCFCMDGQPWKTEQREVTYYPIPNHKKKTKEKILDFIHYNDVSRDEISWSYYLIRFKEVITDFKPDVIEVFGSELYTGLATMAARELNVPCCLHVQGILSLYMYSFLPPGMSELSYCLNQGIRKAYYKFQYLTYWRRSIYREKKILQAVPHVIGRTEWDRQAMSILAPQAEYHYGGEILRPCFYEVSERTIPAKPVIITTSSNASYKGFDLVLKTADILKNVMHIDFEWKVFGNLSPHFFEDITNLKHGDLSIHLCGVATAEQLRETLLHSTVYVQPSYIENSPNSVAEAQILGIPVVATNVGGTSSMVTHGTDGFLFPATDPYMAAYYIKSLIEDKNNVNMEIGTQAHKKATLRHDKQEIITQLLNTYKEILTE